MAAAAAAGGIGFDNYSRWPEIAPTGLGHWVRYLDGLLGKVWVSGTICNVDTRYQPRSINKGHSANNNNNN